MKDLFGRWFQDAGLLPRNDLNLGSLARLWDRGLCPGNWLGKLAESTKAGGKKGDQQGRTGMAMPHSGDVHSGGELTLWSHPKLKWGDWASMSTGWPVFGRRLPLGRGRNEPWGRQLHSHTAIPRARNSSRHSQQRGRSPPSRTGSLGNLPQHPPSRLSLALTISPQPDLATTNLSSAITLDLESEEEGMCLLKFLSFLSWNEPWCLEHRKIEGLGEGREEWRGRREGWIRSLQYPQSHVGRGLHTDVSSSNCWICPWELDSDFSVCLSVHPSGDSVSSFQLCPLGYIYIMILLLPKHFPCVFVNAQ